jgi:hypothetical protein
MEIWGGYPAGQRDIFSWDRDKNVTFPADLKAPTLTATTSLTAPAITVGSNAVWHAGNLAKSEFAAAVHTHDDRYYTESEMDTKLSTKSDTGHTHAYSSLTGIPSTFTPSAHTHLWADITDKPSTFTPSAHTHAISDVTGLSTALAGKSDTTHNHDTVYLKLAGGTLTGSLNVQADNKYFGIDTTAAPRMGIYKKSGQGPVIAVGNATDFEVQQTSGTDIGDPVNQTVTSLMKVGASTFTYKGQGVWHSGNFTPSDKLDATTAMIKLDTTGSSTYPRLVLANNPGTDTNGWVRVNSDAAGLIPYSNGNSYLGTSSWKFKEMHSVNFYENGTALSSKYLGISAKATDSDKLDGLDSTQFLRSDVTSTIAGHLTIDQNNLYFKTSSGWAGWARGMRWQKQDGTEMGSVVGYGSDGNSLSQVQVNVGANQYTFNSDGTLKVAGNTVYHTGNLPSYVGTGNNSSVGTGFTVNGTMYLGSTSAGTNNGDLIIRGAGNSTIHLDGDGSGNINSGTVKAYVNGSTGDATFSGRMTANSIAVTSATMVSNLNAETLQGKRPYEFDGTASNADIASYGVVSGLRPKQNGQLSPDNAVRIEPGVVYTSSGRRFEFTNDFTGTVAASQSFDRWDIFYVRGPVNGSGQPDPSNEGVIQYGQGASDGLLPTPPAGSVLITKVLIKANTGSGTVQDGFTTSAVTPNLYDIRQWRPVRYESNTFKVDGAIQSQNDITEAGSMLKDKYARLGFDNTFTGKQLINSGSLEVRGVVNNDATPAELFLSEFDGTSDFGFRLRYMPAGNIFKIVRDDGNNVYDVMTMIRDTGFTEFKSDVQIDEHLTAKKNATTLTIAAGQTTATWTHNYGATTYAVSTTQSSFDRHLRFDPAKKLANTYTVEIDTPTTQDILVDCILIGY